MSEFTLNRTSSKPAAARQPDPRGLVWKASDFKLNISAALTLLGVLIDQQMARIAAAPASYPFGDEISKSLRMAKTNLTLGGDLLLKWAQEGQMNTLAMAKSARLIKGAGKDVSEAMDLVGFILSQSWSDLRSMAWTDLLAILGPLYAVLTSDQILQDDLDMIASDLTELTDSVCRAITRAADNQSTTATNGEVDDEARARKLAGHTS